MTVAVKLIACAARSRLVHFAFVGLIVWKIAPVRDGERTLVVDASTVADAVRTEQARLSRALMPDEKQRIMEDLVSNEVLYREGVRLGIGGDDPVVRARVADRMRSHLQGSTAGASLDDDNVRLEASRLAARMPVRVKLRIAFVSKERPDAAAVSDALAQSLAHTPSGAAPYGGDRAPVDTDAWWLEEDLARIAGTSVARAAMETAVGSWSPPLASAWGFYVVCPLERRAPTADELTAVAGAAVQRKQQDDSVARAISRIRSDYSVRVQVPAGEPPFDSERPRSSAGRSTRTESTRTESTRTESTRTESTRTESTRTEGMRTEGVN